MTHKGTAVLSPNRRGMRAVNATTQAALRDLAKRSNANAMERITGANEITIGKAIDGMPIKESAAQRLEDWAQAYEKPLTVLKVDHKTKTVTFG